MKEEFVCDNALPLKVETVLYNCTTSVRTFLDEKNMKNRIICSTRVPLVAEKLYTSYGTLTKNNVIRRMIFIPTVANRATTTFTLVVDDLQHSLFTKKYKPSPVESNTISDITSKRNSPKIMNGKETASMSTSLEKQ